MTEARLWRGSGFSFIATQANDGSVAVSGGPESADTAGESSDFGTEDVGSQPLVVFPHGDADQPSVVGSANRTSVTTQYCGEKLYELQLARWNSALDHDFLGDLLAPRPPRFRESGRGALLGIFGLGGDEIQYAERLGYSAGEGA